MMRYFLFILASFGYLSYLFLIGRVDRGQILPFPPYFNLIAPFLLAVSAGLFLKQKTRHAGLFGVIGLTIASSDILSNWLLIESVMGSRFIFQFFIFQSLTTILLLFLGFISIKALIPDDKNRFEMTPRKLKANSATIIGIIPSAVILILISAWIVIRN